MFQLRCLTLVSAMALLGCGPTSSGSASGGSGGSDTGGSGGGPGSGGAPGTGGSPGTGGTPGTGGSPGTGGTPGTGGSPGTGGGGNTGGTGHTGGTGGVTDGGSDGPRDAGAGGTGGTGGSLDACFANLPAFTERYQIATKTSADGGTRVRVVLQRMVGGVGTSGTIPWVFIRFGIERGTLRACVTDAAQLKYMGSLHNCMDKATATANGVVYTLTAPDRASATVAASGAGAFPATPLTNSACKSSDGNLCGSGGPCQ